jgi:hypothetical protein
MSVVTKSRKITIDGVEAEQWEVRERGAAGLRSIYTRFLTDGEATYYPKAKRLANGTLYRSFTKVPVRKGEVHVRTGRGQWHTWRTLVPSFRLREGMSTNFIYTEAAGDFVIEDGD